jgi:hypothetical protein
MRFFNYIFFLLLVSSAVAFAGATIRSSSLLAQSDGNNVTIQWGTTEESGMLRFVVERQASGQTEWVGLDPFVAPKGSNSSYAFVDQSAFKTTVSVYRYRIRIEAYDGTTYSNVIVVSHDVSSVKRTWGSLKAMFR